MRLFCLLLLLLPFFGVAQPKYGQALLDSLVAELARAKDDTNKVNLLNIIAFEYGSVSPNDGIRYARQELSLAKKIGWKKGEAKAYNVLGTNYQNMADFPSSFESYFKALSIAEEMGFKKEMASILGNMGLAYWRQKNFPKALEYQEKSMKIAEEIGDKERIMASLNNMGLIYKDENRNKEALSYFLKTMKMAEVLNHKEGILVSNQNIGSVYSHLKDYPAAIAYRQKSLRLAREAGNNQVIAASLGNIGLEHLYIAKDTGYSRPDTLVPAGKPANLARAKEYLISGITAGREIRYNEVIPGFLNALSEVYALQGDYKSALEAFRQSSAANDSIFNTANSEKISELETKRAHELKDKDILIARLELEKKRNERVFYIAGILLLLGIVAILLRSYKRQQQSNKLLVMEKKRSDDLLLNILPSEVADELKDHGSSAARQYDEVSVLFTDFVDFTGASEKLSPRELVQELNECFTAFDAIIEKNGLEKIKTIGDAYMAVCGLPIADPFHGRKTVQAALEILDFMEQRKKHAQAFEIRIGVNSGSAVAGIVGVKKFAYDIWGDTVNTAARMQQHGAAQKVNISESTYELVEDDFPC